VYNGITVNFGKWYNGITVKLSYKTGDFVKGKKIRVIPLYNKGAAWTFSMRERLSFEIDGNTLFHKIILRRK